MTKRPPASSLTSTLVGFLLTLCLARYLPNETSETRLGRKRRERREGSVPCHRAQTEIRMKDPDVRDLRFEVPAAGSVSALLMMPPRPKACFVFAHGAGAGMTHSFMEEAAAGLGDRG